MRSGLALLLLAVAAAVNAGILSSQTLRAMPPRSPAPTRYFWQLSDVHTEIGYCVGCFPSNFCRKTPDGGAPGSAGHSSGSSSSSSTNQPAGPMGSYGCDSPVRLTTETFQFMQSESQALEQATGFKPAILWTGDSGPHALDASDSGNMGLSVAITSRLMTNLFTGYQVFPAIGNLDFYPDAQEPPIVNNQYIVQLAGLWGNWLSPGALATFSENGYYVEPLDATTQVVVLNTVLWFYKNPLVHPSKMPDPLGQMAWLESVLASAWGNRTEGHSVIIMGHVPPQHFHKSYNEGFISLMRKYYPVVSGLVFAHWHQDVFSLLWETDKDSSTPLLVQFSQTSVTPRRGRNPSVRVYSYEPSAAAQPLKITDWTNFIAVLTTANTQNHTSWLTEYTASAVYSQFGLKDFSVDSFNALYQEIKTQGDAYKALIARVNANPNFQCSSSCADTLLLKMMCVDLKNSKCDAVQTFDAHAEEAENFHDTKPWWSQSDLGQ